MQPILFTAPVHLVGRLQPGRRVYDVLLCYTSFVLLFKMMYQVTPRG